MKIAISYFYKMAALRFESLNWQLSNKGYLRCTFTCSEGSRTIQKHVLVHYMNTGEFSENVDHIDGNTLNNESSNLRSSTKSQNSCNRKTPTTNKLGIKNVCWFAAKRLWRVSVVKDKKRHVKYFKELEDAVEYADKVRAEIHGNFARI